MKNKIVCKICSVECANMGMHLKIHGITTKEYFDKYLATEENTHCKLCHKPLTHFFKLSAGYGKYCEQCSYQDKIKAAYHNKDAKELQEIQRKRDASLKFHYGENWMEHIIMKFKETVANRTPEKRAEISKHHHDERMQRDNIKMVNAIKKTKKERHGNENYNNIEKNKKTCLEKYGVDNVSKAPEIIEHMWDDYRERTGFANPMLNPDVISRMRKKYTYNGVTFDSSWELAYYIYLKDHNIEFEYHIEPIDYTFENNPHRYYPDFKVNGKIIEIKNPELLRRMIENVYTLDHAKYQCMKNNDVIILSDLTEELNYINETYGNDYLSQFRN